MHECLPLSYALINIVLIYLRNEYAHNEPTLTLVLDGWRWPVLLMMEATLNYAVYLKITTQ